MKMATEVIVENSMIFPCMILISKGIVLPPPQFPGFPYDIFLIKCALRFV